MGQNIFIVLTLIFMVQGQYFDPLDLNTLGQRISAHVAAQVAPLQGLGERISHQVQDQLRPAQVNLNNRLRELDGLGDRISQQVYNDLEPVRAIELNFKIRDGVGGVTVATYRPNGQQLIIKDYKYFTCSGSINTDTGECNGSLQPFEITSSSPRSDWCFYKSYSLINDQICLSVGSVTIQSINNHVTCKSADDKPILLIYLNDYKRLCSSVSETAEYRYIPNNSDPMHVDIPNQNKYVKCENRQNNLCVFHERNGLLDTYAGGASVISVYNGGTRVKHS